MNDGAGTAFGLGAGNANSPTRLDFRSAERMYAVSLVQDLFDDWVVVQSWGGRFTQRGGGKIRAVASYDDGIAQVQRIAKQRIAHGYAVTPQPFNPSDIRDGSPVPARTPIKRRACSWSAAAEQQSRKLNLPCGVHSLDLFLINFCLERL